MVNLKIEDVEQIEQVLSTLHDWSGVSHDTPDDTEVLESNGLVVTLGDLKDAFNTLARCKELIASKK